MTRPNRITIMASEFLADARDAARDVRAIDTSPLSRQEQADAETLAALLDTVSQLLEVSLGAREEWAVSELEQISIPIGEPS